jgi:hypothetical protein
MGLLKKTELDTGLEAEYFNIYSLTKNLDISRGVETIVTMSVYKDQSARLNEKKEIKKEIFLINHVFSFSDAYTELKKLFFFQGATDC